MDEKLRLEIDKIRNNDLSSYQEFYKLTYGYVSSKVKEVNPGIDDEAAKQIVYDTYQALYKGLNQTADASMFYGYADQIIASKKVNIAAAPQQMMQVPPPVKPTEKKKKSKLPIVIASVVLLAVIIAVVVLLVLPKVKSKKNVSELTIAGKEYKITAEEGIEGFGDIDNKAFITMAAPREPICKKMVNGNRTDEDLDLKDATVVRAANFGVITSFEATMGTVVADNGYQLRAKVLSMAYERYMGKPVDMSAVSFFIKNDFSFAGLDENSSISEITDAGFIKTPLSRKDTTCYYNIYTDEPIDWADVEDEYERLAKKEIMHAELARDPKVAIPGYGVDYMIAYSFIPLDMMRLDLGIMKSMESTPIAGDYSYKDMRMFAVGLGQQLQRLRAGEIDKIVIAEIDCSEPDMYYFGCKSLNLIVITKESYIKTWPGKWGYEVQE